MGALEQARPVFAAWQTRSFSWGKSDCLSFCVAVRRAVTGREFDLPVYNSAVSAARRLHELGFRSIADLVDSQLPRVPVPLARRGDWVMRDLPGTLPGAFGVVEGRRAVFFSEEGLVRLPVLESVAAWRAT